MKKQKKLGKRETGQIVKSFLNEEALKKFVAVREMSTFYKLYKIYDNPDFWRVYKLPFKLNSLVWFLNGDGARTIKADYKIFHLDIKPKFSLNEITLMDKKVGEDIPRPNKKAKNIADFLR